MEGGGGDKRVPTCLVTEIPSDSGSKPGWQNSDYCLGNEKNLTVLLCLRVFGNWGTVLGPIGSERQGHAGPVGGKGSQDWLDGGDAVGGNK